MIWRRAVLAVAVLLVACVKDDSPEVKTVSMPSLETETTLRVVHAVNPRLPRLDQAQLERMLSEASRVVREHFGIEVRFVIAGEIGVDRLFDTIPASLWKLAGNHFILWRLITYDT